MSQIGYRKTALMLGAAGIALALGVGAADAQTVAAGADQQNADIVVTATRREETLAKVPLAISAITGDQLTKANVYSFEELTRVEPTINIQNYGASFNQFIIRGIESDVAATTGIYYDEMPLLGGEPTEGGGDGTPSLRLIDLQRVEVLRGPQGTLFGSGSMAGTIRLITNKPKLDDFSGTVSSSLATIKGGKAFYQGNIVVNIPVSHTFAIRAVAWSELGGGYIDQTFNGITRKNVNDEYVRGGRIEALWQPIEAFSLLATASHQEITVDGTQNWNRASGDYNSNAQSLEPFHDNLDLYDLTGTYDVGFGKIIAIGSYTSYQFNRPKDTTPTNAAFGLPGTALYEQKQQFRAYTGEVRFASDFKGPVQIVAGAYYQNDKTFFTDAAAQTNPDSGKPYCAFYYPCIDDGQIGTLEYATALDHKVEQYAFYGQVDWHILPKLVATGGLRYFHAKVSDQAYALQDISDWFRGVVTTPYQTQSDQSVQHKISYNAALRYEFTPQISVYARAASGYRVGGTNNSENAAANFGLTIPSGYKPDNLWDYEGGIKASLFNRKLYIDASGYHIDWNGQQLPATDPTGAFEYIINAGKTTINGGEVQFSGNPVRGLNLRLGMVYTDARLAQDLPAAVLAGGVIGYKGDRIPRVPKFTLNASAEYEQPVMESIDGYISGSLSHRSMSYYEFSSDPSNLRLKPYTLINAAIGLRHAGRWDASIFGQNLTNKAAELGIFSSLDGTKVYSPPPRTIGFRVTADF